MLQTAGGSVQWTQAHPAMGGSGEGVRGAVAPRMIGSLRRGSRLAKGGLLSRAWLFPHVYPRDGLVSKSIVRGLHRPVQDPFQLQIWDGPENIVNRLLHKIGQGKAN